MNTPEGTRKLLAKDPDHFVKLGAKGGGAKVLKGIHWLRVHDPKKYKEACQKISDKSKLRRVK